MKAWNAGDFESFKTIIRRDTGDHGDYDHAAYIQDYQDHGLRLMEKFKQSFRKLIGVSLYTDVSQKHDTKFQKLKDIQIPNKSTDDTEY